MTAQMLDFLELKSRVSPVRFRPCPLFIFKMYSTYILISESTGKLYIGQTNNLNARISRHNSNKNFTTKKGPWRLLFSKDFNTRSEAMMYEKKLKSIKKKEYLISKIERNEF